jgi:hypothetical protein
MGPSLSTDGPYMGPSLSTEGPWSVSIKRGSLGPSYSNRSRCIGLVAKFSDGNYTLHAVEYFDGRSTS